MEPNFELAAGDLARLSDIAGMALVVLAALSTAAFLLGGRLEQISSLVALALAAALFVLGVPASLIAVLLLTTSILLSNWNMNALRRRLASLDAELASIASSVRILEIAEERRQIVGSRQPLSSSAKALAKQASDTEPG